MCRTHVTRTNEERHTYSRRHKWVTSHVQTHTWTRHVTRTASVSSCNNNPTLQLAHLKKTFLNTCCATLHSHTVRCNTLNIYIHICALTHPPTHQQPHALSCSSQKKFSFQGSPSLETKISFTWNKDSQFESNVRLSYFKQAWNVSDRSHILKQIFPLRKHPSTFSFPKKKNHSKEAFLSHLPRTSTLAPTVLLHAKYVHSYMRTHPPTHHARRNSQPTARKEALREAKRMCVRGTRKLRVRVYTCTWVCVCDCVYLPVQKCKHAPQGDWGQSKMLEHRHLLHTT